MKKCYATLLLAALCSTATLAQQQDSLITQPAAGETINLYRTTTGYESVYYYAVDHQSTGDWQRMVFGEDGAVYLENPINSIYTQTWIKGYRTEGDTIAFQLPQAIFSEEDVFSGDTRYGYLERVRPGERNGKQTLVPNEDPADQVLKYVWHGDSLKMVLPDGELIGMCLASGSWTSYAEATYKGVRMDNNTMVPPASATVNDGLMLYMDMEGQSQLYPVRYALDGSDVYLGDLSANVKGYWIKGTMDGTTVTFPATSFVGIDTLTACYVYASSAVVGKGKDEMGTEFDKACFSGEPLVFTYDADNNSLSTKGILMVHKSMDDDRSTNIFDAYRYALISRWDKKPAAPMPPKLTAYQPYDPNPWGGPGGLQYSLSYYSADFNYLDPSCLYYNLYIDGEVVTFSPDDYANLKEEMTDVPYAFTDGYEFYKYDENDRTIYFYKEVKEKIGMEAFYIDGDVRLGSGVAEYYPNGVPDGIDISEASMKQIERVEYRDLSGRVVSRPAKGIFVRTITYSDGSRATRKVVK